MSKLLLSVVLFWPFLVSAETLRCAGVATAIVETPNTLFLQENFDRMAKTGRRTWTHLSNETLERFDAYVTETHLAPEKALASVLSFIDLARGIDLLDLRSGETGDRALLMGLEVMKPLHVLERSPEQVVTILKQVRLYQAQESRVVNTYPQNLHGRYGGVTSIATVAVVQFPSLLKSLIYLRQVSPRADGTKRFSEIPDLTYKKVIDQQDTEEGVKQKTWLTGFWHSIGGPDNLNLGPKDQQQQ